MLNPFKKQYTITEYKNQNGQSIFIVRYCSLFDSLFEWVKVLPEYYVYNGGRLCNRYEDIEFSSIECAKKAIEDHKINAVENLKKVYKKRSIHYVE